MIENELYVVKGHIFDYPLITEKDSIIDKCRKDCHNKYFHIFKNKSIYDIQLRNITNKEIINLTISDKSMHLYELKKN